MKLIKPVARAWWFLPLLLLPQLIPPYTSHGYPLRDWGMVNAYILTHPVKGYFSGFYPVFQIIPLAFLAAIYIVGEKAARLFCVFVALSYGAIAVLQSVSISDRYGVSFFTANVITFLGIAGLWIEEAISPKNNFIVRKRPVWRYWPDRKSVV